MKGSPYRLRKRLAAGSTLIVVLLILATLSFGVYTFSETVLLEYKAMRHGTNEVRTIAAAAAGVQWAAHDLGKTATLTWKDSQDDQIGFMLLQGPPGTHLAHQSGILDECAKLNLNTLDLSPENFRRSRLRLLAIPGMTATAADSILDWMDEDEEPREFGAESNWYLSNGYSYTPKQDAFGELQELLLVRGVSLDLLFGQDRNANQWPDWDETQNSNTIKIASTQTAASEFQVGWSRWLTVESAESNLGPNSRPRININQPSLQDLFLELETALGTDAARFIVAMRMNGPIEAQTEPRYDSAEAIEQRIEGAQQRAISQTKESRRFDYFRAAEMGGFLINRAPTYSFLSIVDLLEARTRASINGNDEILRSPWAGQGRKVSDNLRYLEPLLTIHAGADSPGRINFLRAERPVLLTIPGIDPQVVNAIIKLQGKIAGNESADYNVGLLCEHQIVDLKNLKKIAPYLTAGGDVFSGVSIGQISGSRLLCAYSFLIDATDNSVSTHRMIRHPIFHESMWKPH